MKKLLIGLIAVVFAFPVYAADMDVYGRLNYMITNSDDSSGNPILKAENNGSKIGIDFSETLSEGAVGITGFAKLEVGIDADDSGSDTFDSRLAYAGVDLGTLGSVSGGRQSHPNSGVGKTGIFNALGSNAVFYYADRSSNSLKYSNSVGALSSDVMVIVDGATGTDGVDVMDVSGSVDIGPLSLAAGYADDVVNSIKYTVVSGGMDVQGISLNGTYSLKDTTTDLTGYEATASYTLDDTTLAVGYGDKENTATYMTIGASYSLSDSVLGYAEYQMTDNTGSTTDTDQMALGLKYTF